MDATSRIEELRRALVRADSGAYLVEPRVIRRLMREIHGYARLSSAIPHAEVQLVNSTTVIALTHPDELGLTSFQQLPEICLLISQPEEEELQHWPMQELLQLIWRRLFHGIIDRQLLDLTKSTLNRGEVQKRIALLGQSEFDEAHFVLNSEHRLFNPESRVEAYCEFVATCLELQRFAPDLLPAWFPSLAGTARVEDVLRRDVDTETLFRTSQLYGAPQPDLTPRVVRDEARLLRTRHDWVMGTGAAPSDRVYLRQLRRRDFANERGNTVAAVICAMTAAERATTDDKREAAREKAQADITHLVERLRQALDFPQQDSAAWRSAMWELATNSIHGFWNADKRLLFDLQKVCLDHERVIYKVDLVKWITSRGTRPLRRPLGNVREVMMAKHLTSSAGRLAYVRLSGVERERLDALLHSAVHLAEQQMRQRMRSKLRDTLIDVGLKPDGIPEKVAFDKLIEESLDCIVARGYLTMGYLRDAISRNDLKLPDLKSASELFRGDHLLRADDRLDLALDGVYRRGEFYLRWLQATSSIFFGTPSGRFATQFIIIPFGGAKIIVVGATHLIHLLTGYGAESPNSALPVEAQERDDLATQAEELQSDITLQQSQLSSDGAATQDAADSTSVESAPAPGQNSENISEALTAARTDELTEESSVSSDIDEDVDLSEPRASTLQAADDPFVGFVERETEFSSLALVIVVGFVLMGLIHIDSFRQWAFRRLQECWKLTKLIFFELPLKLLRLPLLQAFWKSRSIVRIRRWLLNPLTFSWLTFRLIPDIAAGAPLSWWWTGTIAALLSVALNSRLGRDAEELTAEWLINFWHHLHARVIMAVIEWIIDAFKLLLGLLERFLYAVDEWLRFHSGESWLTLIAKAVLGVIWSFVSFVIRIYVNLLIEPTFHPVKHFPVVTVAHKMFLPFLMVLDSEMRSALTPYLGAPLALSVTWFNIFFLPGFFGFAVWELKENWRLYAANRRPTLGATIVGSHGETISRLLRPGFHSGTLPKLYRRMRRLEQKPDSFRRFSLRRATRELLHHSERDVRHFVERELIRLLELCSVWQGFGLRCGQIHAATNSLQICIECDRLSDRPLQMIFQEQSGWTVAGILHPGWLSFASGQQIRSLENALDGFYRKAGIDLVREQIQSGLTQSYEYDINSHGLTIWPSATFESEIVVDLHRRHQLRPQPANEAAQADLHPTDRGRVLFGDSETSWDAWEQLWQPADSSATTNAPPAACSRRPVRTLLRLPF